MGDWIHCNYCSSKPGSKSGKFFLASCGEIVCQKCLSESKGDPVCKVCKQQMQVVEINRQLKPDMQMYFMDLKEVIKRQGKQLAQIAEFQTKHRTRERKFANDQLKQAGKVIGHFKEEMEKKAKTEKNFESLKEQYSHLYAEQKKTQSQLMQVMEEHRKLSEHIERQNRREKPADQFTLTYNDGPSNTDYDMFRKLKQSHHNLDFPAKTPNQSPLTTSTPKNQVLTCGRISMALSGGRNSGSGGNQRNRTPTQMSPAASITTPDMLGIGRHENSSARTGNPYDGVWKGQNGSPIQISPRTMARNTFPPPTSVQPPIRLPFTLNKNTLS